MVKTTMMMAALAAVAVASFAGPASALDNKTYALYSAGKSSNDSWDRCDDDRGPKMSQGWGRDDDRCTCVSKKPRQHADNGWGNGGDSTNPGSDKGGTRDTKFPSVYR